MNGDRNIVLLCRHGETKLNSAGQLRGRLDPPLSVAGLRDVDALAEYLAPLHPATIVSSPLTRAVQTATAISRRAAIPIELDGDLVDRDYGRWAGRSQREVVQRWGSLDDAPGVEPRDRFDARVRRALDRQIAALGDRPIVLVGHDAVNTHLLAMLDPSLGDPIEIPQRTSCFNRLRYDGRHWHVLTIDQKRWVTEPAADR